MPSRMSSLKKRMTLATLLNKNKLPMCCSSVTEKERERNNEYRRRGGKTFRVLIQGQSKAGLHCHVYATKFLAVPGCGLVRVLSPQGIKSVTH